jgi:hypothetical protein
VEAHRIETNANLKAASLGANELRWGQALSTAKKEKGSGLGQDWVRTLNRD